MALGRMADVRRDKDCCIRPSGVQTKMAGHKLPEAPATRKMELSLDRLCETTPCSGGAPQRRIGAVENGRSLSAFATDPYLSSARSQWDGILCEQHRLSHYANEGKTYLNHH